VADGSAVPAVANAVVPDRSVLSVLIPADREALHTRLSAFASAGLLTDQADAFLDLARWVLLAPEGNGPGGTTRQARGERFRTFVELLENDPRARKGFVASFGRMLAQSSAANLFGEAGLPARRSFVSEAADRLAGKVVPSPRNDGDLAELLRRLIPSEREFRRLQRIPADLFHRCVGILSAEDHEGWRVLERDFADGYRLLALWVQSQGLGSRVRSRSGVPVVSHSPFLRLGASTGRLLEAWQRRRGLVPALASWRNDVAACRMVAADVHRHLENQGVNVEIVFALEIIERSLTRMELMAEIIARPHGPARSAAMQQLLARLVYFTFHDRRLRHLVNWNLSLLNRKIVERSGKTGEHYIAHTPKEYVRVWAASAGGGALTVFTAAIKLAIVGSGLALFQEGFAAGLNYAVSFLLLQAFDLMLATKQPAMTAATLANIIRDHRGVTWRGRL